MQKKSAILQMLFGERGNIDNIPQSEKYKNALSILCDKEKQLLKHLGKHPNLLTLYKEYEEALAIENAQLELDIYREAFSFGLAIGLEVK